MTELEFAKLSWKLLEAKVRYYLYPELDNILDSEYDIMEKEYLKYCEENETENTIQSMVGVDQERPCVLCVIKKILGE